MANGEDDPPTPRWDAATTIFVKKASDAEEDWQYEIKVTAWTTKDCSAFAYIKSTCGTAAKSLFSHADSAAAVWTKLKDHYSLQPSLTRM